MKEINENSKSTPITLTSALVATSEHLVQYADAICVKDRGHHLGEVITTGRYAARCFAIRFIDSAYHERSLSLQEAEDITQEAAMKIFTRQMLVRCESIICNARSKNEKVSGEGTDLKAFLFRVIKRRTIDALRVHNHELRDLATRCEIDSDVEREYADFPRSRLGKATNRKLEILSRCNRATEFHDRYLAQRRYRGLPLASVLTSLGEWTPAKEWAGAMTVADRPKAIPSRTAQRFDEEARAFIRKHMKGELDGPCL